MEENETREVHRKSKLVNSKGDIMDSPLEVIAYYTNRIIESPITKGSFSILTLWLYRIFGPIGAPMTYLMIVVFIDLILGISKSIKRHINNNGHTTSEFMAMCFGVICSKSLRNGLWKIIEYLAAVGIANIVGQLIGYYEIREFVIIYMVFTELKSIHENLTILGFDVPLANTILIQGHDHMKAKIDRMNGKISKKESEENEYND